jgi:hypothetical protein
LSGLTWRPESAELRRLAWRPAPVGSPGGEHSQGEEQFGEVFAAVHQVAAGAVPMPGEMDLDDAGRKAKFLIRDRDGKHPMMFDAILADAGIHVVLSQVERVEDQFDAATDQVRVDLVAVRCCPGNVDSGR